MESLSTMNEYQVVIASLEYGSPIVTKAKEAEKESVGDMNTGGGGSAHASCCCRGRP